MNLRKFKHDPADLLRQGEEIAAARNIDPRYKFRVVAVNMVLSGRNTVAQAAELAGVSRGEACKRLGENCRSRGLMPR